MPTSIINRDLLILQGAKIVCRQHIRSAFVDFISEFGHNLLADDDTIAVAYQKLDRAKAGIQTLSPYDIAFFLMV